MPNSLNDILKRMQDLGERSVSHTLFEVLYGPTGAGKTLMALEQARRLRARFGGRTLYLDSSDGWVSAEDYAFLREDVTRFPVTDSKDMGAIANAMVTGKKGFTGFTSLIIDELSSIAEDVLENVVREVHSLTKEEDIMNIEGKDYGPMTSIINGILRQFRRVPGLHIIVIAHDNVRQVDGMKEVHTASFSPKLNNAVQKFSHVTGYVTSRTQNIKGQVSTTREVQAQPSLSVQAKSRISDMPLKVGVNEFIQRVDEWVGGEHFAEDVTANEAELEKDVDAPLGGIDPDPEVPDEPVAQDDSSPSDEDDDTPAFVGQPE